MEEPPVGFYSIISVWSAVPILSIHPSLQDDLQHTYYLLAIRINHKYFIGVLNFDIHFKLCIF
jgi:hypothetical protein